MSYNAEIPKRDFGDSSQLTNCILYSDATCHMTPDISDFIPGSLVKTDKYIEIAKGPFFAYKQTGEFQMKICYDNGNPFIAVL